jgi:hypothetical protein
MRTILPEHLPRIELPVAVAFAAGACVSILAVLLLVLSFNSGPDRNASEPAQSANATAAPEPSRVLGGSPPKDASCENQTWPYIDQRCLSQAASKQAKGAQEQAELTPNIEVRPQPPQPPQPTAKNSEPASTDGVASTSDRALEKELATAPVSEPTGLPDRPTAITGTTAMASAPPAAEPQAQAASDRRSEKAAPSRPKTRDARRPERTARAKDDSSRIVRRWREVEYRDADGKTRKVIYVKPGTLQRDSFFDTLR